MPFSAVLRRALFVIAAAFPLLAAVQPGLTAPRFRAIVIAERGGIHKPFVDAAKLWLQEFATKQNFGVDYIENTDLLTDAFLAKYQLFIQLNYPPYMWTEAAMASFQKYIEEGKGGWIGFHHATLLGEFDGYQMWPWFSWFMGGIRFTGYIPNFATAKVIVEDPEHPVMKNIKSPFTVYQEEWYTYNKSPRPNIHVLATVDENSYVPSDVPKMGGDHPVVWTNPHVKARNVYIFMGHHPNLFNNESFVTLAQNAILWASER